MPKFHKEMNKFLSYIFLISVTLCLGHLSTFAQQPSYFNLGKEQFDGIQIYDVIQDKQLNYWFATDHGFYKYDGHIYKKVDCRDMNGLSAFGFVQDQKGTIYCHNLNNQIIKIEDGICSIFYELIEEERSNDISLIISFQNNLVIVSRTILSFNKNGEKIKFGTPGGCYFGFPFINKNGEVLSHVLALDSVIVINGNASKVVPIIYDGPKIMGVLKFFVMEGETFAISTMDKRVFKFDESTFKLKLVMEFESVKISDFLRFYNENDQLWLAGAVSGVRLLANKNQKDVSATMYSEYIISDVFKDNEGNILLSTFNNGVLVIPNLEIPDVLSIPKENTLISICQNKSLGMILGSLNGKLYGYQDQDGKFNTISNNGIRPIHSIFSWPDFPYIIFDDGKIKAYNIKTGEITELIAAALKDATIMGDGSLFLALNVGVAKVSLIQPKKYVGGIIPALKLRTYAIEREPESENVYVATSDGLKIIKQKGDIENVNFENVNIFANDLSSDKNTLYVSTKGSGILFFKQGKIVGRVNPKVNEEEIEIYKLVVYENRIYTNSSQGFVVMDMKGEVLLQLNLVHGFSTNKIYDFEIVNDQLWICHSKGVQKISLNKLSSNTIKPLIAITAIEVDDSSLVNIESKVFFESDQRKFRFTISSPTIRNRENVKYYYKLIGYEEEWIVSGFDNNQILYNALAPGNYTFLVKAENQGIYSEVVAYSFVIASPFYLRWWFITIVLFLFFSIIYFIYRWQLSIQNKKAELRNELNASKLTAIQSQMNPHFIFNALNSIQDLVLKGDIDNSYTFIAKFSNLIRRTLNYSDKDFIEFEQELKLIELYLSLEKLRFKEELNFSIHSEEIEGIMVPPLLIQPFIENALVHGILHKEGEKKLSISFQLTEVLICTIEDNGVGREKAREIKLRQKSEHESFSNQAIKKRFQILKNHFEGDLGFKYEDLYEGEITCGTRVILFIPIKHTF